MKTSVINAVKKKTTKNSRAVVNQNTRKRKSKLGRLTLAQPLLIKRKEKEADSSRDMI